MTFPPIQDDEVYVRCPSCGLIGWTIDDPDQPTPLCPSCDVHSEEVGKDPRLIEGGQFDVQIIDGPPVDPAHHLTGADLW